MMYGLASQVHLFIRNYTSLGRFFYILTTQLVSGINTEDENTKECLNVEQVYTTYFNES